MGPPALPWIRHWIIYVKGTWRTMKVITWACRPVGITQLCFLLFVLGISSSTCGPLTIFRPQLHTQGVKKFLNYLQNTIQTSNSIFFKKHMNYRNKRTNTKIVKELHLFTMQIVESALWNYRTWKVACLQKNLLAWKTGQDFLSSVVLAPREYHKQKGMDLKKPH